ncbi:MAG: pyridoxal-phosphate dependent enzyme [Gemmatimonadaceae bacterium]
MADSTLPLVRRFPALGRIPRVALGTFPTPLERVRHASLAGELWVKRDDLSATLLGGNKVRALEWLLGDLRAGDTVVTIGGEGSTHVLATAEHAAALGIRTHAARWRHDMHPVAHAVGARAGALVATRAIHRTPAGAIFRAWRLQLGGARWIPGGGTTPLGILGHVNAALELAEQAAAGEMPAPSAIVVPLGTGGTAAGIALGLAIAGLDCTVVCARVAPRIVANAWRVRALANATARFIERRTGERVPRVPGARIRVTHAVYGGAYGRPLVAAGDWAAAARETLGLTLDDTYSAKAFAAALDLARAGEPVTLFWSTFDARWLSTAAVGRRLSAVGEPTSSSRNANGV